MPYNGKGEGCQDLQGLRGEYNAHLAQAFPVLIPNVNVVGARTVKEPCDGQWWTVSLV